MSTPYEFEHRLGGSTQIRVKYTYSPGTPDVFYLPNGDPGYPGDPEEISVDSVELKVGENWIDATELLDLLGCFEDGDSPINQAINEDLEKRYQDDVEERVADDIEAEVWEGREFP